MPGLRPHQKLQRLRLVVHDGVKGQHTVNAAGRTHGPDIPGNMGTAKPLGTDDGADAHLPEHISVLDAVDFGDDLWHPHMACEHGQNHILLIHAGQGDDCVIVLQSLSQQDILPRPVRFDDGGLWHGLGQLHTAGMVPLDDFHADAAVDAPPGQIEGNAGAAHDQKAPHPVVIQPQIFHQLGQVLDAGGDIDGIPLPQSEGARRDMHPVLPLHSADQHVDPGDLIELEQRNARQLGPGSHGNGHDLHLALGKGLPFQKRGELKQLIGLLSGGLLRVYGKGKPQLLPHGYQLVGIFRIPHPGDGMGCPQLLAGEAGQKVQLIPAGGGNEHVGLLRPRLPQRDHGGPVAGDRHHVQLLRAGIEHLRVGVNDGNVMPLGGKLPGQSRSHLAVAYNNNVHIHPILLGEMFEKCPYSLP